MAETTADRLAEIRQRIGRAERDAGRAPGSAELIAVSKTFAAEDIVPVIEAGQRLFGENRVQEAKGKWPALKATHPDIELHLIGPLQSNKAREEIAAAIASEMNALGRKPKLFVQVNTGLEPQKAGIDPREAKAFLDLCRMTYGLEIAGLMCIPPADEEPGPHFALLAKIARECDLPRLSMGMSSDFETAIAFGATHVRVGSAIFGKRDYPVHA
jgi:pyridoxal phosphate enzyme (YggS family)